MAQHSSTSTFAVVLTPYLRAFCGDIQCHVQPAAMWAASCHNLDLANQKTKGATEGYRAQ